MKYLGKSSRKCFLKLATKILLSSLLLTIPLLATALCLDSTRLTGVNTAGAEFHSDRLPGIPDKDYAYPKDAELSFIAAQGANVVRLPFRWERIQHQAQSALDPSELKRIQQTVLAANNKGLCVILDIHNYAKYYGQSLQDNISLQYAFMDLWVRLANVFTDPNSTVFELMNEPKYISNAQWAGLAKQTVGKLRKANSKNLIFVGGGNWSGLHDWFTDRDGVSNASVFADLSDPLKRTVLEVHQYADAGFSGTGTDCLSADIFNSKFERISAWAAEHKQQLFLGEFGVPQSINCFIVLERFLTLTTGSVWKGWSYWATGGWWGTYPLAINTDSKAPSRQWIILKKYFNQSLMSASPPMPPTTVK